MAILDSPRSNVYTMETTIQKWGNSLAVRLPKELAKKLKLQEGSAVLVAEDSKRRIIIKHTSQKKIRLIDLVAKIDRSNAHREIEWGARQGKEAW